MALGASGAAAATAARDGWQLQQHQRPAAEVIGGNEIAFHSCPLVMRRKFEWVLGKRSRGDSTSSMFLAGEEETWTRSLEKQVNILSKHE